VAGCAAANTFHFLDGISMNPFPSTIRKLSSADGGVVLDLQRGTMLRVNPLGARVLDLLERGDSPSQIAESLSAEFQVPLAQVQADVAEFTASLRTRGVLTVG
jgi:hypothetical protein